MALKKLKVIREYDADYWKIIQINAGFEGTAEVTFGLFKNRAAAAKRENVMDTRTVSIRFDQFKGLLKKVYPDAQAELDELSDAEPVLE